MNYSAKNVQLGEAYLASVVAAQTARPAGALIVGPKLRLSKDPAFRVLFGTVISDLAAGECDFSNYTAGGYTPTLVSPVGLGDGVVGLVGTQIAELLVATPTVPNTIYGWWIDDGTHFLAGEKMDKVGGFVLGIPGDFLILNYAIPFLGQMGVTV